MVKKLLVLFLVVAPLTASAAQTITYNCTGQKVSGMVQVALSHQPTNSDLFPYYKTRSNLKIAGKSVKLNCGGNLSYFRREIPGGHGAWKYDMNTRIFALCGADLGYSGWGEGFHLEVGRRGVRGYLGHRDHLQGPQNQSAYDFYCR